MNPETPIPIQSRRLWIPTTPISCCSHNLAEHVLSIFARTLTDTLTNSIMTLKTQEVISVKLCSIQSRYILRTRYFATICSTQLAERFGFSSEHSIIDCLPPIYRYTSLDDRYWLTSLTPGCHTINCCLRRDRYQRTLAHSLYCHVTA